MNGPTEPNAELRKMAATFFEVFTALNQVGFTRDEALKIVALMIAQSRP